MLDEFENGVVVDAEWYRLDYHDCEHDASQPIPACPAWSEGERQNGTIPDGV